MTHRSREEKLCVDSCRFQTGRGIMMTKNEVVAREMDDKMVGATYDTLV